MSTSLQHCKAWDAATNNFGNVRKQAHDEAMRMVLFKIARIATAQVHHDDNYEDLIGYARIAQRIAKGEKI